MVVAEDGVGWSFINYNFSIIHSLKQSFSLGEQTLGVSMSFKEMT